MAESENRNFHIILLDDKGTTHRVIALALREQLGCRVTVVEEPKELFRLAKSDPPQLFLLDFYMDEGTGIKLCQQLKGLVAVQNVPIIFFSDGPDAVLRARAVRLGAVEFMKKPFFPKELITRISAHIKLEAARARDRRQIREQQALLRVLCHDLRNPVAAVASSLELVEPSSEEGRDFLSLAKEANESALELIEHVQIHRELLETGQNYERKKEDLAELVEHSLAIIAHMAEKKQIRLVSEIEKDSPVFVNKMVFLHNILNNLLTNAVKFSHENASVRIIGGIEFINGEPFTVVRIEDDGIGIPPKILEVVFQPNERESRLGTARESGQGLGLSLVKHYVEASCGTISIESSTGTEQVPSDSGTTVTLRFPQG
ncbi:MAG: ATP-binding protein [Opitutales bacterium]